MHQSDVEVMMLPSDVEEMILPLSDEVATIQAQFVVVAMIATHHSDEAVTSSVAMIVEESDTMTEARQCVVEAMTVLDRLEVEEMIPLTGELANHLTVLRKKVRHGEQ